MNLAPETSRDEASPEVILTITPGRAFLCLLLVVAILGCLLTAHALYQETRAVSASEVSTTSPTVSTGLANVSGPPNWGDLIYNRISVERPDAFISMDLLTYEETRWFFGNASLEQITQLLNQLPLTPNQRVILAESNRWVVASNSVMVTPGSDLILGLNPEARQQLYPVLARYSENLTHRFPFYFRADGVNQWFESSGLSAQSLASVTNLLYRRGEAVCFSDLWEVATRIPSDLEKRRLLKTLGRQSTMLVKLKVRPESDIDALTRYWGKAGRAKDIRPLLQSLAQVPGGVTIDICHLLPPFARERLYTYPPDTAEPPNWDCYWTAMNFFNEKPDDRFLNLEHVMKVLNEEYYEVQSFPALGDVILFSKPGEGLAHAAVYIAADLVFTKNGAHPMQPWTLMSLADMRAAYPSEAPLAQKSYRLKKL